VLLNCGHYPLGDAVSFALLRVVGLADTQLRLNAVSVKSERLPDGVDFGRGFAVLRAGVLVRDASAGRFRLFLVERSQHSKSSYGLGGLGSR
jgi:hypothetical protein